MLERQKMKNVTIALPEIFANNIDKLQELGMVPSRSEAIRLAIRDFLKKEKNVVDLLGFHSENANFGEIKDISLYDLLLLILEKNPSNLEQIAVKVPIIPKEVILKALIELEKEEMIVKKDNLWVRWT